MTTWILTMILIIDNSRVATTSIATQEFSSKEKCEIAKSNFISLTKSKTEYTAYCIEK